MSFYIACENETFEDAINNTIIAAGSVQDAAEYIFPDFLNGLISSFKIFNQDNIVVFESVRSV